MSNLQVRVDGESLVITAHALQRFIERGIRLQKFSTKDIKGRSHVLICEMLERSSPGFFINGNNYGRGYRYDDWLFVRRDGDRIVTVYALGDEKYDTEFYDWDSEIFTKGVKNDLF